MDDFWISAFERRRRRWREPPKGMWKFSSSGLPIRRMRARMRTSAARCAMRWPMQTGRKIEGLDWGASHLLSGSV